MVAIRGRSCLLFGPAGDLKRMIATSAYGPLWKFVFFFSSNVYVARPCRRHRKARYADQFRSWCQKPDRLELFDRLVLQNSKKTKAVSTPVQSGITIGSFFAGKQSEVAHDAWHLTASQRCYYTKLTKFLVRRGLVQQPPIYSISFGASPKKPIEHILNLQINNPCLEKGSCLIPKAV